MYAEADVARLRELIGWDAESGGWQSAPYHTDYLTTDIYERIPEMAKIVFNEAYIRHVQGIFGKGAIILAEPAIHKSRYYYWHKDSTFIDELGECYHWQDDFAGAMTVLYLQDNTEEYGGGITVVPGTHHDADFYHRIPGMNVLERGVLKLKKIAGVSHFDRLDKHPKLFRIPSQKGDLLVLDMRIDHKGTPAVKPAPYTKYGIMNIACDSELTANRIRATLRRRPSTYYSSYLASQPRTTPVLDRIGRELGVRIWL